MQVADQAMIRAQLLDRNHRSKCSSFVREQVHAFGCCYYCSEKHSIGRTLRQARNSCSP
jgi:hypothetical protein